MAALTYEGLGDWLLAACVRQQPAAAAPFFSTTQADAFFLVNYPEAIRYAEGRIYKEIVFLATRAQNSSLSTTSGTRRLDLSRMTTGSLPNTTPAVALVVEGFALITPAGVAATANGTRVPFDEATLDVIDMVWPTESITAAPNLTDFNPRYWAMLDDHTLVFCPTADGAYLALVTGLFQPVPLSASNTTTYISTIYPELLEAACMVFMTGALLKNFGAQAASPQMALSWEGQTQQLMALAKAEERRRRGLAPDVAMPPQQGRPG